MEAYTRSEQTKSFTQGRKIQNGDTGNHQDIPPTRGVGHLDRFQGHLLPYTNTGAVQEISWRFHVQGQTYQFKALPFGLSNKGVSVDQIMQDCHWKAHNTFTNFYLKDLTWSDNDNNMYLGPVVAAQ